MAPRRQWARIVLSVVGMATGVALFMVALGWATTAAAGGHGSYLPAKVLFPWGMFVAHLCDYICDAALVLGAVQFPIYGAFLGSSSTWAALGRRLAIVCFAHIAAAVLAAFVVTSAPN